MRPTAILGKRRRMTNVQMVARLDTTARRHDIPSAWRWYQLLQQRRTRETTQPTQSTTLPHPPHDTRIVPRRQQHSAQSYALEDKMLSALTHKRLGYYTPADLSTLRQMATTLVNTLHRRGGTLSPALLVQLLDVCAADGKEGGLLADALWQRAALDGVRDAACWNAYANTRVRAGHAGEAAEVVREVDGGGAGVCPTAYTRALEIRLHGAAGDLAAARRVFETVRAGIPGVRRTADYTRNGIGLSGLVALNTGTYDAMLDVLGMNGLLDEMQTLFFDLCGHPSAKSLDHLVQIVSRFPYASSRRRLRPRMSTFRSLIRWHAKYWDVSGCVTWIESMHVFGLRPDAAILRSVVTPENAVRELQACGALALRLAEHYGVETPVEVVRTLERAAKKVARMHDQVRAAMGQPSTLWSS
ncbi:hypothetical protein IW150_005149 [Coemansia sp. RSA 2607]|nr:hypothetical protein IW150_005149 [Coemansia sp. RSA 2607]